MKKLLAVLLALAMILSLAACGAKEEPAPTGGDSESTGLPGEGKKIALVCDVMGTQVFVIQQDKALKAAAEKYGFEARTVECADSAAYEDNIRALIAEEFDMIIVGGWTGGDALGKVANEFPDAAAYALVDSTIDAEAVRCVGYREQEGAFLIGMLAAYCVDPEEATIFGGVHCNEGAGSWKYRYGYMEGVKTVYPDAKFVFNYTGSYSDAPKAKEFAIQQYEQGCRFINGAAAGGDSGVYEAAKEYGFFTSGQDVDETTPDNPWIISSEIKDTYQTIMNLVDDYFNGNWTKENVTWGINEGGIGAVNVTHDSENPRHENLTDEEIAEIQAYAEKIGSFEIDMRTIPDEADYAF